MSNPPEGALRALPPSPSLEHLRSQAKDLLRAGQAPALAAAQFRIAREYGFASWPKLKAHVERFEEAGRLQESINRNDLEEVRRQIRRDPSLLHAPIGYSKGGALTWAAECRGKATPPSPERLALARFLIQAGAAPQEHTNGPLLRAALSDGRIPMLELLVEKGADVNARWHADYPIVCAPCEALAPLALKWLLDHGANPRVDGKYGTLPALLLGTYGRNPKGKNACLEILVQAGLELPETPALAFHRGRLDRLEEHLKREPNLLHRCFTEAEIFPPELGLRPGDGLCATPVAGTTLLHMALEYDDLETARWLIEHGADVNARAAVDADGFGGHTPLFHAVVSLGKRDDAKARLLLDHGADPRMRATLRKQLKDMGDPEKEKLREYRDVTPVEYARAFMEPRWVSAPAVEALEGAEK